MTAPNNDTKTQRTHTNLQQWTIRKQKIIVNFCLGLFSSRVARLLKWKLIMAGIGPFLCSKIICLLANDEKENESKMHCTSFFHSIFGMLKLTETITSTKKKEHNGFVVFCSLYPIANFCIHLENECENLWVVGFYFCVRWWKTWLHYTFITALERTHTSLPPLSYSF